MAGRCTTELRRAPQTVVERPLMVQWVVGSIPHGGLIKLFLVPANRDSGVPLSLSESSFTICLTHIHVNNMC